MHIHIHIHIYSYIHIYEGRPIINVVAAACGNLMSSFVFVPKEAVKQVRLL